MGGVGLGTMRRAAKLLAPEYKMVRDGLNVHATSAKSVQTTCQRIAQAKQDYQVILVLVLCWSCVGLVLGCLVLSCLSCLLVEFLSCFRILVEF